MAKFYVLEMLRFGDRENHSYIVGIYSSEVNAKFAGAVEETWRGGKYQKCVSAFELNAPIPEDEYNYHCGFSVTGGE